MESYPKFSLRDHALRVMTSSYLAEFAIPLDFRISRPTHVSASASIAADKAYDSEVYLM